MSRNARQLNVPQCCGSLECPAMRDTSAPKYMMSPPSADVAFILPVNALKWLKSASKCMLNIHRSQNKRYFHVHGVSHIIAGHSNLPHCETFECPAMSRDIQMSRGNFFAQGPMRARDISISRELAHGGPCGRESGAARNSNDE